MFRYWWKTTYAWIQRWKVFETFPLNKSRLCPRSVSIDQSRPLAVWKVGPRRVDLPQIFRTRFGSSGCVGRLAGTEILYRCFNLWIFSNTLNLFFAFSHYIRCSLLFNAEPFVKVDFLRKESLYLLYYLEKGGNCAKGRLFLEGKWFRTVWTLGIYVWYTMVYRILNFTLLSVYGNCLHFISLNTYPLSGMQSKHNIFYTP